MTRRAAPLPAKLVHELAKHLEQKQGCRVVLKSKGYWVGFPNGESTTFHLSCSDYRAVKNVRAVVKRNGCVWPWD